MSHGAVGLGGPPLCADAGSGIANAAPISPSAIAARATDFCPVQIERLTAADLRRRTGKRLIARPLPRAMAFLAERAASDRRPRREVSAHNRRVSRTSAEARREDAVCGPPDVSDNK